jgi:hypothetical protein
MILCSVAIEVSGRDVDQIIAVGIVGLKCGFSEHRGCE